MTDTNPEQELWKSCGFCCDGTLFEYADVKDDDILLPGMEEDYQEQRCFRQPCPHFKDLCTAYHLQRPSICCSYKCTMLIKASKGKIPFTEVAQLVVQIKAQKARLEKMLAAFPGVTLTQRYKEFQQKNAAQKDTIEFRLQYKELLMEWALYGARLKKFSSD